MYNPKMAPFQPENIDRTTSMLMEMKQKGQLAQYMQQHTANPYLMALASSVNNMFNKAQIPQGGEPPKVIDQELAQMAAPQTAQAMPEDIGIGALPAGDMNFADGGIVGYADGGPIAFADRGAVKDPLAQYEDQIRAEALRQGVDPDMAMRLFRQESGGKTEAVSPKGAVGLGQLMVPAAKEMGLKPEERTDPNKNIPASIGYFKKQLDRFKTPEAALAAYNWGPGNVAKHLAQNEGQINRVGLPKETADYLTKILPVGTASAASEKEGVASGAPVQPSTQRTSNVSQIPGQRGETIPEPAAPAPSMSGNQKLFGIPEAALHYGTGILGLGVGAGNALLGAGSAALEGRAPTPKELEERFASGQQAVTFQPRSEAGVEALDAATRALTASKLPPIFPGAMGVGPSRGAVGRLGEKADMGVYRAEAANAAAKEATAANIGPRLPGGGNPETIAARTRARFDAAAAKNAAADATQAAGTAERIGTINAKRNAALAGITGLGLTTPSTSEQPEMAAADDGSYGRAEQKRMSERQQDVPKEVKKEAIDIAKAATPKAERKGLTNEDYLTLGLGLLANKSASFGQALGEAGLGTIKMQRERVKEEREAENEAFKNKYYSGLARQAEAAANAYESGNRVLPQALKAGNDAYDDWFKSLNPMQQMELTPEQIAAKRQEYIQSALAQFKIAGSTADTGGFKMVGSRPGP